MNYKEILINTNFLLKNKNMELTEKRKTELKKITNQSPGFISQGDLGTFFDLYLVCESTARKII